MMYRRTGFLLIAIVFLATSAVSARRVSRHSQVADTPRLAERNGLSLDVKPDDRFAAGAAAADTTVLGSWSFETGVVCVDENWTSVDRWEQLATFFHVDDFAGLGGGSFGRLAPLEGTQSMWCGARTGALPELCGYATLPGYGNAWEQTLTSACVAPTGDLTVDFLTTWDVEEDYDYVYVEYDTCSGVWNEAAVYTATGSGFQSITVPAALLGSGARVRFRVSSDGSFSDEDGQYNSDGAIILDSLTVRDVGGVLTATETFEGEAVGDTITLSGSWTGSTPPGYGDFAGLFPGVVLVQEDPCNTNVSCMWAFINGSNFNYACGGFPNQISVPMPNARGQGIWNEIWSPQVPLLGTGSSIQMAFDIYRDLDFNSLIFYTWRIRSITNGCPGNWRKRTSVYYGAQKDWFRSINEIGDMIDPGATEVQIALGVRDMCHVWCGTTVRNACNSHAPLFDNVEIVRIDSQGPQWSVRAFNLFQDTFAEDGTVTGTARADAAVDKLPATNLNIRPGDSVVVNVSDLENGLAADAMSGFGSAVYAHVAVWPPNQPGKAGSALTDDNFRWPVVDSTLHNGSMWYVIRMDTSFTTPSRTSQVSDQFCVDLEDNLFTPGDTICFFFSAKSAGTGATTYWSEFTGATSNINEVLTQPMEFMILPGGGWLRGGDILYVDGYDGFGAQPFFDQAWLWVVGDPGEVDRFDIRAPDALVGNHPGARVKDVTQQLLNCYRVIVWNTGDLNTGLIGDGQSFEKSDDAAMLVTFLEGLPENGGVYFSGDNMATDLATLTGASGTDLRSYIPYTLIDDDHKSRGLPNSVIVEGEPGSCFDDVPDPHRFWALGSCPTIASFDVVSAVGSSSTMEMSYDTQSSGNGAVVGNQTVNTQGKTAGVMLSGFSYHTIRDDVPQGGGAQQDRPQHMEAILNWLGLVTPIVDNVLPASNRNTLAQNYPNPFNPTTTIEFTLRERSRVRLSIYNVAGQLVRTLVDDEKTQGVVHSISWDGTNAAGQSVASGLYFYRLVTQEFTQTKKMVLLK